MFRIRYLNYFTCIMVTMSYTRINMKSTALRYATDTLSSLLSHESTDQFSIKKNNYIRLPNNLFTTTLCAETHRLAAFGPVETPYGETSSSEILHSSKLHLLNFQFVRYRPPKLNEISLFRIGEKQKKRFFFPVRPNPLSLPASTMVYT